MNKEQLQQSIDQITEAIALINNCEGYDYLKAHHTTQLMIAERHRMEKELNETYIIIVNGEEVTRIIGKLKASKEARAWAKANPDYPVSSEKW